MFDDEFIIHPPKMNNNDRHRIKSQMESIFNNLIRLKRSSFYKYIIKYINRLIILNDMPYMSELRDWSYDKFKNRISEYVRILTNRK